MASRRSLKKSISYIIDDLLLITLYPNVNKEVVMNSITNIIDLIPRISHTEPKNAKAYYKQLRKDLNSEIATAVAEFDKVKND